MTKLNMDLHVYIDVLAGLSLIFGSFKKTPQNRMEKKLRRFYITTPPSPPKRLHACCSKTGALGLQSHEPTPISLRALFGFGGATEDGLSGIVSSWT